MSKSKETTELYGRDRTMPNNNYDDYSSASTATEVKFRDESPYAFKRRWEQPKSPPPTQDTSEFNPARRDSTREDDWVRLIETYLRRAKAYMTKDDPIQASEKLYKTAEEAIKFLAEYYKLSEAREAKDGGQWWNKLLNRASMSLVKKTGKQLIDDAWGKAYRAHVFGFHESAYSIKDVKPVVSVVEKLVEYVQEVNDARRPRNP